LLVAHPVDLATCRAQIAPPIVRGHSRV